MDHPRPATRLHPLVGAALAVGGLLLLAALLLNPVWLLPALVLLVGGGTYAVLDRRRQRA